MGLDIVELVMTIEDEFQLTVPVEIAPRLVRVGDFYGFVLDALRRRGEPADPAQVWVRLKNVFLNRCAVREEQIVPGARLVEDFGLD